MAFQFNTEVKTSRLMGEALDSAPEELSFGKTVAMTSALVAATVAAAGLTMGVIAGVGSAIGGVQERRAAKKTAKDLRSII